MKVYIVLLFICSFQGLFSQSNAEYAIAKQSYDNKNYTKADSLMQLIYDKNQVYNYPLFKKILIAEKKYAEALKLAKSIQTLEPSNMEYSLDLVDIMQWQGETKNSQKELEKTIDIASKDARQLQSLLRLFKQKNINEAQILLILKAREVLKNNSLYQQVLVACYLAKKDYTKASQELIQHIDDESTDYFNVLDQIQGYINQKEFISSIEKHIYSQLSKNASSDKWNDLAMRLAIQTKQFEDAMDMAKSIDKRKNTNGSMVFEVSKLAMNDSQYRMAIDGFDYIVAKYPTSNMAKLAMETKLLCRTNMLQASENTMDSVNIAHSLSSEYQSYFENYSYNPSTASVQIQYASYLVLYVHSLDSASAILKKLIAKPNLSKEWKSNAKLFLGDIYLMQGEIWEAALLYEQVDKEEKDSPLGEEARFKNSRLFYYQGEFELAQDLLSILKSSTTELIANDALYLSVFIQENMDGDTLEQAMKGVAQSELLFNQNKDAAAMSLLYSIKTKNVNSNLMDDILMIEATYHIKKKQYLKAESILNTVKESFNTSILADKAIYLLGTIQEEFLKKPDKAKENYLYLITNYKDSVYSTDSRKRFRKLRGEVLEEDPL